MPSEKRALITGVTGQDGSFLAEQLLGDGYAVTGLVREAPGQALGRELGASEHLRGRIELMAGDLLDPASLREALARVNPDELYHLAAPSFVPASWEQPADTTAAIAGGCAALLEAVRDLDAGTRVFVSSSGAMFGDAPESPQNERTPCFPSNPYAIAKLAAHNLCGAMRRHEGLHVSSGIVYNHESERRPELFVTRRISRGAAAISLGLQDELTLGSLCSVRDWSFAGDIMAGARLMLAQDEPADYVLASGVGRTVAEFACAAFACVGLDHERYVRSDPDLARPAEPTRSVGDPSRARELLGWRPQLSFEQLVERMVEHDLRALRDGAPGQHV
ncbi:MAG TPA: GDP-mannose 4,6-dehydratase [Solirubrobacteraceae bacterium]